MFSMLHVIRALQMLRMMMMVMMMTVTLKRIKFGSTRFSCKRFFASFFAASYHFLHRLAYAHGMITATWRFLRLGAFLIAERCPWSNCVWPEIVIT